MIGVYFPHGGYSENEVQHVYTILTGIVEEARNLQEMIMVAGDFNAEIGGRAEQDNSKYIGPCTMGEQNFRGFLLKRWCELQHLTIANSIFPKSQDQLETFRDPNQRPRQIDYILVCSRMKKRLRDVSTTGEIHMGSDHRAIKARMNVVLKTSNRPKTHGKHRIVWEQVCLRSFERETEVALQESSGTQSLQKYCEQIENILLTAARNSTNQTSDETQTADEEGHALKVMIQARQAAGHNDPNRKRL